MIIEGLAANLSRLSSSAGPNRTMAEEKQQFIDKSKDKKWMTIIPNLIVNGYSGIEAGVYLYIKKRAGEEGQFFETAKNAAKKLKISKPTYLKIRDKLERDGRIKFVGWKESKTHPIKVYEVVDIWGENLGRYKKKGKNKNLSLGRKVKIKTLERSKIDTQKKNPIEKEPIIKKNQEEEDLKKLKKYKDLKKKDLFIPGIGQVPVK